MIISLLKTQSFHIAAKNVGGKYSFKNSNTETDTERNL